MAGLPLAAGAALFRRPHRWLTKTASCGSRRGTSGGTIPTWLKWKRNSPRKSNWRKRRACEISYLDTHYVMPYNEHYRPVMERLGKKYGLPVSCLLGEHELDDFGIYYRASGGKGKGAGTGAAKA